MPAELPAGTLNQIQIWIVEGTRLIGKHVAHYSIIEKLGEGGMGLVYKARDAHLDRFGTSGWSSGGANEKDRAAADCARGPGGRAAARFATLRAAGGPREAVDFLKYTHPAATAVDWDQALVRAMPKVSAAKTEDEFLDAADAMLGELPGEKRSSTCRSSVGRA